MKKIVIYTIFIISAFLLSSVFLENAEEPTIVSEVEVIEEDKYLPTRRQLMNAFFQKREVLVVYGTEDIDLGKRYKELGEEMEKKPVKFYGSDFIIRFKNVKTITQKELKEDILFLVGTSNANPLIKELGKKVPMSFSEKALVFNGINYTDENDMLSLSFFPNPNNDQLPFSFITSNNETMLYNYFSKTIHEGGQLFFRQNMDYEINRGGTRIMLGNFNRDWKFDETVYFDYSEGNKLIHTSDHYDFISHQRSILQEDVVELATYIETSTKKVIDFIGNKTIPKMQYHIYNTAESKGLMVGNTTQAHFDEEKNSIYTIVNQKYASNFIQKEHELILLNTIGSSPIKGLTRGLAISFTDKWQREGYKYWTAHLYRSKNVLSVQELLDNELVDKESPLIVDCMSASFVDFLLDEWGRTIFLKNYSGWKPTDKEIKKLEKRWESYLSNQAAQTEPKPRKKEKLAYLKGFNFAHEGYDIYNGYLSNKATEAIQKQQKLGSNAIAIVPYSSINRENAPTYLYIGTHAGSENDQGIVHSSYEAKQLGMASILKPQLYFSNSWPGALDYETEEGWDGFFNYYYRWIRHYAFLAEIHQLDALCMGVEFQIATLSHEEGWRKMFRNIKGLYQGQLTYAANWGEEFEKVKFWDELDFIGINSYYPLSKKDNPTDKELKANFEEVKTKIRKVAQEFEKPIVFTEIGFRSIDAPWKNPHANGKTPFNAEHQDRCYQIIFEGIKDEPWCNGILWWKFPSYIEYRGVENNAFTPNGKKAEETIKKWFQGS